MTDRHCAGGCGFLAAPRMSCGHEQYPSFDLHSLVMDHVGCYAAAVRNSVRFPMHRLILQRWFFGIMLCLRSSAESSRV